MSAQVLGNMEDKAITLACDELPYFTEKFPGTVCCLCNLGEKSALGQGELCQLKVPTELKTKKPLNPSNNDFNAVQKLKHGIKNKTANYSESAYELDKIGYSDILSASLFIADEFVYVHRMCIMWSLRKKHVTDSEIVPFLNHLSEFLQQKCSFCEQYGASITCKMNCRQIHHWPCAAAAGCLLILESFTVFCTEHLSQVPLICIDNNVKCLICSSLGDLSKLTMCCSCGDHFHSTCIGLTNLPETRSGWTCGRCVKCQICRQQDSSDIRYVKCEQCQKLYHTTCLRPIISSIPKYGWKCNRCRICTDCGSRTPGGGSSSRWHSHYTICDSCYQQRNKGFSCPICQKAYRAAAYKEMVKCSCCHKFVHSTCDDEADLIEYHKKKEINPDYDYVCPNCKTNSAANHLKLVEPTERCIAEFQSSDQLHIKDGETDFLDGKSCADISNEDPLKLTNNKKKICLTNSRGKGGRLLLHRMGSISQIGKRRSNRGKGRQLVLQSSSNDRYIGRNLDTDLSSDKKMFLCSALDKYVLTQDFCVLCGSVGIESDAVLITCAQCGQCYHSYCAGVKPSRGILQKGWRCLDCTVCEGCGKKNDEARLLLCDECDISYHIYCVNPPLETVPHGNWKCSFCTICQKCGRNPTDKAGYSDTNTAECLPCISQSNCNICTKAYSDGEVIIHCDHCSYWSHLLCDSNHSHQVVEYYDVNKYKCPKCRSDTSTVSCNENTLNTTISANINQEGKNQNVIDSNVISTNELLESTEYPIHWIDGVCLSESGLNLIKSLSTEIKRKRKMRQSIGNLNKDIQMDTTVSEEIQTDKYKDGMIWEGGENALPDGFSISTNDDGVQVLRKKRQRNLQKLGIGGFSVRNRSFKKDNDDSVDQISSVLVVDKKKKIIRKKQKNKLIEAYPAYLQEAFFGKPLLESGDPVLYDSDSSDQIDSTVKILFTYSKPDDQINMSTKSSPKLLKKVLPEKLFTEHKKKDDNICDTGTFGKFLLKKKKIAKFTIINEHVPTSLKGTSTSVNIISSSTEVQKSLCESSDFVPSQLTQDQNLSSKLFLPANLLVKPQQMHYQIKSQNITPHVPFQNDKRNVEELKTNEPSLECINVGTQKTAEKMRRDEDLGLMATISAVLYANTEHSNLKDLYPNWNDRCKQILKRWRSLCNEKKAPFLQKAKDNRSALRQRREQCKMTQPSKSEKQEDISIWNNHISREEQTNLFTNYSKRFYIRINSSYILITILNVFYLDEVTYDTRYIESTVHSSNTHNPTDILDGNVLVKTTIQGTALLPTASSSLKLSAVESRLEQSPSCAPEPVGDKKLRNLLQKTSSEAILMPSTPELFLHNDVIRLGLIQNQTFTQNNPMLSMSGNNQHTELKSLEQDGKNQLDMKMTESQEVMSSSAVELENVGFGDILGGFGEGDDDDLLKSLTSEIGDDFNILEYADPELDVNVLNTLDFEDNEKNST
ncbi:hypothetical protein KR222_008590 [Zaprionus bogoriensis]|nr:hypothetical protein KR222_008590 [Zaprionus bogoriensis]